MRPNTSVIFNGAALALTALLHATPAHAQTTGSLRGTVKDVSGAVIPHATVIVINTATSAQRDEVTDDQGAYPFTLFPIGRYDLDIPFPACAPFRRTALV